MAHLLLLLRHLPLHLHLIAVSRISLVHRSLIVRLLLDSTLKGIPLLKSCVASEDVLDYLSLLLWPAPHSESEGLYTRESPKPVT